MAQTVCFKDFQNYIQTVFIVRFVIVVVLKCLTSPSFFAALPLHLKKALQSIQNVRGQQAIWRSELLLAA